MAKRSPLTQDLQVVKEPDANQNANTHMCPLGSRIRSASGHKTGQKIAMMNTKRYAPQLTAAASVE